MSAIYDITADQLRALNYRPLHAGDDYDHKFTVERPPGTPLDLTNAKIWFTIKETSDEADAQAKLQLDSSDSEQIQITSVLAGQFTVKFRGTGAKTTENLEGEHIYDIQVKMGDGTIITVGTGRIEFLENITRSTT